MDTFLQTTAILLSGISFLASFSVTVRLKQPASFAWWVLKVFAGALALFFISAGLLSVLLSVTSGQVWVIFPGIYSVVIFSLYLLRAKNAVLHTATGFNQLYGPDWENTIAPDRKKRFLASPIVWSLPQPSGFALQQDIAFCTIPSTNRQLLCDVWTPAGDVKRSGLAFIYFHGSAWGVLDKDFGTRPFFKHLVSQGHVIMDVAYRLFPETDMTGMVHDVYRAIAWMKNHSNEYQINPDRIVVGGGSAGGHLALLAAYDKNAAFIPAELKGTDLSVHAVISEYGPSDLLTMYYHTGQHITMHQQNQGTKPSPSPEWVKKMMGKSFHRLGMDKDASGIGILPVILGCYPDKSPEVYQAFSPVTYVHKDCPPTLILQGSHDLITPVESAQKLYKSLTRAGAAAVLFIIPQADHAFDLILPGISPVSHTVFYVIERFLALQVETTLPQRL